jgi:nucleoside-diphosphate-sugar epimerase
VKQRKEKGGKAKMRVLITGSSGQLGTEIAHQLVAAGHKPVGLDLIPGRYTTHLGTINDKTLLDELLSEVEGVIHIASLHARHLDHFSKQAFIDTNLSGLLTLLEGCANAKIRRLVYTSTTSVYGFAMVPTDRAVWVNEALTPRPRDIYDITKLAAEELCRNFALEEGLSTICLRTSRFFPEPPHLTALYRLYRGVDVRDVAAAHILALLATQPLQFDLFNVSASHPYQPDELVALLSNPMEVLTRYYPGLEQTFQQRGWPLPRRIDRVYVTSRIEQQLGFKARYNFEQYLEELA